ncbi:sensor histidine kinase, partial [Rubrivirga sp.]|uniref:sensor histidine kinase n=1 Tax=Rubrivirga sp. TaxID=1885344 RepID=UPI003C77E09C
FLVRVVRELLFNVVKHSGVLEATVTVRSVPDGVCIEVADQGHGFDPASAPSGFGIATARDRLGLVGGALEVETALGEGTRTTVVSPTGTVGSS